MSDAQRAKLAEMVESLLELEAGTMIHEGARANVRRAREACKATSDEDVPRDFMRLLDKVAEAAQLLYMFERCLGSFGAGDRSEYKAFVDEVYKKL